jgi:hypothetical protein
MSDYKFVIYEKLDGDAHTSRMLEEEHHGNVPEEITDKQLNTHHVGEKDTLMEDLLEKARTGSAEVVLEKNLNESKDQFGSKHRNPSAYEGDINKLEEKRLAEKHREESEYEVASETPKRQRWWDVKSEDGLKVAFKREAQSDLGLNDIDWDYLEGRDDELEGLDELDDTLNDDLLDDSYDFEVDDVDGGEEILEEVSYSELDVGGTPTASGVIRVSNPEFYDSQDDPRLKSDLKDHMSVSHNDLPFSMSSFDLSKFDQGIITYRIGIGGDFEIDEIDALSSRNFPIVEASKKK